MSEGNRVDYGANRMLINSQCGKFAEPGKTTMQLTPDQEAAMAAFEDSLRAEKDAADKAAVDAMKPGDLAMTHDGTRLIMDKDRNLVVDRRTRKQRRRDAAKARK